jgi:large subunit ribosomal protein L6
MEEIIEIPDGIQTELNDFRIKITGSKGTLEKDFYSPIFRKDITIKKIDNKISISTESKKKKIKAMIGTMKANIFNMFTGVREGFSAQLKIVYMHFPFTVKISENKILINNFLGEKNPRKAKIIGNCKVEVKGDEIVVTGISKDDVGQTAAQLERATWIKKRDRRVFQDGVFITKKP